MLKELEISITAQDVFTGEISELELIKNRIDKVFAETVQAIYSSKGRVIVVGVGKSAHIANKIVATFNSTGTPSQFLHATEAIHGDLGLIAKEDVVICISKSGNTPEIREVLPYLKEYSSKLIAMTGNISSELAKQADFILDVTVSKEMCPNNVVPTSSTTAQLVMGDALAVCLMRMNNFSGDNFARFHPGGALGKQLLWKVENVVDASMKPSVTPESSINEVINSLTSGKNGISVLLEKDKVVGVITDGDLRRMLQKHTDFQHLRAKDIASFSPKTISKDELATKAFTVLRENSIAQLVVLDENKKYYGILHIHALINEGIES